MATTIETLHDLLCPFLPDAPQQLRMEENHQYLIKKLNRKCRRRVLRIIDDLETLRLESSYDSFAVGLKLGMTLVEELHKVSGHPPSANTGLNDRFFDDCNGDA